MDFKNRRAYPRIASTQLPAPAQVRIPNRPAISLVDLSRGGALLELPFQLQPSLRLTIELISKGERIAVPFQLLRCYVADIKDGIRYHAAGAFDARFKLPKTLSGGLTLSESDRLIATLETFLQASQQVDPGSCGGRFNKLLEWVVAVLRRGEPPAVVSSQLKLHLAEVFPSLSISPSSKAFAGDAATSARYFGFDFKSRRTLSASDRQFLRANAQLLNLIDGHVEQQASNTGIASAIVHDLADWQTVKRTA